MDASSQHGIATTFGSDAFGGGVSFHDFNQDGWDDLTFATQLGDSLVFYENIGGTFQEVYFEGIHHAGHVKQILWCDYDNDGDKDLYVAGRSWDNFIYVNDGAFSFTPYLLEAPAPFFTGDTYCAAFGDYDLDGDLDLFVGNHIESIPLPNELWLNNGDGTMTNITPQFHFDSIYLLTFAASWIDIDNDMYPDLYTAEDRFGANQLYMNNTIGGLEDQCEGCGAEIVINAMSVCPGDYDKDGDLDIYVSNTQQGNALLNNNGDGTFTNIAQIAGVGYYRVAWGATFFDYDNDKDLDLYVSGSTNGTTMTNELYENLDLANFTEVTQGFVGDSTRSFSHAIGDIDNDGYFDIAVLNINPDSSQLWQSSGGTNNWIKIKLEGTISNKEGIGAWIEVWSDGDRQVHYTHCGTGYIAQNTDYIGFGLGPSGLLDSVIVSWPSGIIDKVVSNSSNTVIQILEGSTLPTSVESPYQSNLLVYPNPTSEVLYIQTEKELSNSASVRLCNVAGSCEFMDFYVVNDNTISLDLQTIPAGTFIAQIADEMFRGWVKFIRQ